MFKWLNSKKKDNKGFTLVELVIVVAILAILVGLLAPQYTKYVEKSRKAADASNMDEMVNVIKVYAADPVNELEMGKYTITISDSGTKLNVKGTDVSKANAESSDSGLVKEMNASIPKWYNTKVKSQKWGEGGVKKAIIAMVTVGKDGGTSVVYTTEDKPINEDGTVPTNKFDNYMKNGSES